MACLRRCNLCLKRSPMTNDHIFPRSIAVPGQRQINLILKHIDPSSKSKRNTALAQNGLKKRTLCASCNNTTLGANLDPALEHFCKETALQLRNAKFLMRQILHLKGIQLNKVARAVAGHFIANDDTPEYKHKLSKALRRYVFNSNAPFPENYRFQIWLYPFTEQAIMKDLYHAQFGSGHPPFGISAYKTYPLAFAFSDPTENPNYKLHGVLDVTDYLSKKPEHSFNIQLDTNAIVDKNWPYAPHKDGAILSAQNESVMTTPKMNIKPYPY